MAPVAPGRARGGRKARRDALSLISVLPSSSRRGEGEMISDWICPGCERKSKRRGRRGTSRDAAVGQHGKIVTGFISLSRARGSDGSAPPRRRHFVAAFSARAEEKKGRYI